MTQLTAVLLGAGARGAGAYAPYSLRYPHELKFIGVAEPDPIKRSRFAEQHGIPEECRYTEWETLLAGEKLADIAIICTQDQMHFGPTMRALEAGYHVLLEKPISPDPKECVELERAAKHYNRLLTICHVLRYTPFWSTMKQVIDEGQIGKIASVQLNENVGFFHMAHSFVRGNWRNSEHSSPMILAKSCHDMDLLSWLVDAECTRVSSYGSLMYFREENAPEGAADRCLNGCPAEPTCAYSAIKFYLDKPNGDWTAFVTEDNSTEGVLQALREGPYGRCVYRCDNNVVDHQVASFEFAGGATAVLSMSAFTHDCTRTIQVMGTKGEIRGHMESRMFTIYNFATGEERQVRVPEREEGHGGGDAGIIRSFLAEVRDYNGGESLTSATASVRSHLMAFAAEQSRRNKGCSIDLNEFRASILAESGNTFVPELT